MPLYLLTLPGTATFSVCDLSPADADEVRGRLAASGAFDNDADEAAGFEPLEPDDRATVDGLIDLWEASRNPRAVQRER